MMKKEVKKTGSGLCIYFNSEDRRNYDIEEGDVIELSDMVVIKKKGKK